MSTDFSGFQLLFEQEPGAERQARHDAEFLRGQSAVLAPFVLPHSLDRTGTPVEFSLPEDPSPDSWRDYWSVYIRLVTFSMNAQYENASQDTRMLDLIGACNEGGPEDALPGETHMLWQCLYWTYRYDRWGEGRDMPKLIVGATRIANEIRRRLLWLRVREHEQSYAPNATLTDTWVTPVWEALWDIPRVAESAKEIPLRRCDRDLGLRSASIPDHTLRELIATRGGREGLIAATYIAIAKKREFTPVLCALLLRPPVGVAGIGYCLALARMPSREGMEALLSALEVGRNNSLELDPWSFDLLCAVDALMYWATEQPWYDEVEGRLADVAPDFYAASDQMRGGWCSHFYARLEWIRRIAEGSGAAEAAS